MKIDFRDDGTVELNKGRRIISEELFLGLLRLLSAILRDVFSDAVIGEMD